MYNSKYVIWYLESTVDVAKRFGFSEAKVSAMLHRIRGRLGKRLKQEEIG